MTTLSGRPTDWALHDYGWMDDALCAQADPDSMFPDKGSNARPVKAMCQRCDVRETCLEVALATGDITHGIRGGLTPRELRKEQQRRARESTGGEA